MYGNSMPTMPTLRSWIVADSYWHKVKASRSKKLGPDERSLVKDRQARFAHYAIKRGPDGEYYDLQLYKHASCRLFKPEESGEYKIWYSYTGSQTDKRFFWQTMDFRDKEVTTDGREVKVPLHIVHARMDKWSAKLAFTPDRKLIVDRSWHMPHYRAFMTNETKEQRRQATKLAEPFINMAILSMDELKSYDKALSSYGHFDYDWIYHSDVSEEKINEFMSRARRFVERNRRHVYINRQYVEQPITPKELRRILLDDLMTNLYLTKQEGIEPKPMFMDYEDWTPSLKVRRT
jgi:hypothetical protein